MQWPSALVLTLALPHPSALAEVCDKVAREWVPGDPPSGLLGPVAVAALAVACALAWSLRNAWVSALCAGVCVLAAMLAVSDMWLGHEVYRVAVLEGCRSFGRDALEAIVLLAAAALIAAGGLRRRPPLRRQEDTR